MTLTDSDFAFYETFQAQVDAFGLENAFEDRADRNRYRAVAKALKAEKVAPVKAKKATKNETWSDAETDALVTLYLVAHDGQPGEWREVWPVFSKKFPNRSESAFRMHFSVIKGYDAKDAREGLTGGSVALRERLLAVDPVRFAAAA